jgi:hypothetical protein
MTGWAGLFRHTTAREAQSDQRIVMTRNFGSTPRAGSLALAVVTAPGKWIFVVTRDGIGKLRKVKLPKKSRKIRTKRRRYRNRSGLFDLRQDNYLG